MQTPIVKLGTELPIGKVVSIHKDGCKVETDTGVKTYTLLEVEKETKNDE